MTERLPDTPSNDALLSAVGRAAAERDVQDQEATLPQWSTEASRPLSAKARARIASRLTDVVNEGTHASDEHDPVVTPVEPVDLASRRRTSWSGQRTVLALAAVFLGLLMPFAYRSLVDTESQLVATAMLLPSYTVSVQGTTQQQRGVSDTPELSWQVVQPLTLSNRLRIVLTPETAISSKVAARGYFGGDGNWRAIDQRLIEVSEQGAIKLEAIVGAQLDLSLGSVEVLLVIGDSQELPTVEAASDAARKPPSQAQADWRSFLLKFDVGPNR